MIYIVDFKDKWLILNFNIIPLKWTPKEATIFFRLTFWKNKLETFFNFHSYKFETKFKQQQKYLSNNLVRMEQRLNKHFYNSFRKLN